MAALRPGRSMRRIERPWTRYSSKKTKSYIPTLPGTKIHVFNMGEQNPDYDVTLNLVAERPVQIRDNALEAARVVAQKFIEAKLPKGYFMKFLLYPYQVIREKPLAQGAGADRYSMGMKLAFGKPTSRAVQVKQGQTIVRMKTFKSNIVIAKQALKRAAGKLPTPTRIVVEE
ncbi:MAG: 50S ribosomal protein L16 [Candidatus Aenigmarchaeota archaeon]|nr:50S ribosomal protein L16 [Candidatus Aenigmarchaeota archaeon]